MGTPIPQLRQRFPEVDFDDLAAESPADGMWWGLSAREMELFPPHPMYARTGDTVAAARVGDYAAGLKALQERLATFTDWLTARPEQTLLGTPQHTSGSNLT
jgi:hypothetical protein